MKPTEQAFEQHQELTESIWHAATFWKTDSAWSNHLQQINLVCEELRQAKEAISQMQPEWVAIEDELPGDETYAIIWRKGYSPEQTVARQVFNMTHACYCFIDNSLNTYQIGEVVTHWSPMLEPPTK